MHKGLTRIILCIILFNPQNNSIKQVPPIIPHSQISKLSSVQFKTCLWRPNCRVRTWPQIWFQSPCFLSEAICLLWPDCPVLCIVLAFVFFAIMGKELFFLQVSPTGHIWTHTWVVLSKETNQWINSKEQKISFWSRGAPSFPGMWAIRR